jgi:single-strand DNA-binding protein
LAELASSYLEKGSLVLVEGRNETRTWDDKQGVTRRITEIVAGEIQFGPRAGTAKPRGEKPEIAPEETIPALDDDEERSVQLEAMFGEQKEIKPEDIPF